MTKEKEKEIKESWLTRQRIIIGLIGLLPLLALTAILIYHPGSSWNEPPFTDRLNYFIKDKLVDIIIGIITAILFFICTDIFIEKARDQKEKENKVHFLNEIDTLYQRYSRQLYYMDVQSGLSLATRFIEEATSEILVIGTAKSELLKTKTQQTVRGYMKATIDALTNKNIIYKRITKFEITDELREHLKECLDLNKSGLKAEVMVMDEFVTANTFLIVDDKFLFISPTSISSDLDISNQCHITTNERIIATYRNHFNDIYDKGKGMRYIFRDKKELEQNALFDTLKTISDESNSVRTGISAFTSMTQEWQLQYSIQFLKEINERIHLMSNATFEIRHNDVYSNLHSLVASFLNVLKEGDCYETISFPLFWKGFGEGEPKTFFELANERALKRGVDIKRKLILYEDQLSQKEYMESATTAIRINLEWKKLAKKNNYDFKVIFQPTGNANTPFSFAEITKKIDDKNFDKWILAPDNENDPRTSKVYHQAGTIDPKTTIITSFDLKESEIKNAEEHYHMKLKSQSSHLARHIEFLNKDMKFHIADVKSLLEV